MSIMFTDPVCGLLVKPAHAAAVVDLDGTTYYFCGERCQVRFIAEYLYDARQRRDSLRLVADDARGRVVHLIPESANPVVHRRH